MAFIMNKLKNIIGSPSKLSDVEISKLTNNLDLLNKSINALTNDFNNNKTALYSNTDEIHKIVEYDTLTINYDKAYKIIEDKRNNILKKICITLSLEKILYTLKNNNTLIDETTNNYNLTLKNNRKNFNDAIEKEKKNTNAINILKQKQSSNSTNLRTTRDITHERLISNSTIMRDELDRRSDIIDKILSKEKDLPNEINDKNNIDTLSILSLEALEQKLKEPILKKEKIEENKKIKK